MTELRDYQHEAVEAVLSAWAAGTQRPAVVLPCGAGKTVIFSQIAALMNRVHVRRPLVLVNRDELVRQAVSKLQVAAPHLSVGVIQGTRNELNRDLTVASVQTLSRRARLEKVDLNRFDLLIADECHYAAADGWRRVLEHFGAFKPDSGCLAVGFTATMVRTDHRGLGEIWDEVVFERDTRWAIESGFLVPVSAQTVIIPELQLDKIKVRGGDLADGDLGRAMAQAKAGPLVAAAYSEMARDADGELRRGIVFCPTTDLARSFLRDFRAAEIPTELILGDTPVAERQASYARVQRGESRVLMTVMVCSVGFDLPAVEVAVMARPTKSRGLYQQQAGRVLRLSPETGKTDALILDVVGASRLGLASIVDLRLDPEPEPDYIELDELDEDGLPMIIPKILIDAPDEIGWEGVNPFDGTTHMGPPIKATKPKRTPWALTYGGRPFLGPQSNFSAYVFLHQEDDQTWTVGEKPSRGFGKAKRLAQGLTFDAAVAEALDSHPGLAPILRGEATESQRSTLICAADFLIQEPDVDIASLSKQEASQLINVLLASRSLD